MNIHLLCHDKKGLTLVELMIVLVLSLGLMATVYTLYLSQSTMERSQHRVTAMQQDLRAIVEMISHDIMHAGIDTGFKGAKIEGIPGDISGNQYLRMRMNLNDDEDTSDENEDIAYRLSGTTLERFDFNLSSGGVAKPIADNVSLILFTYRDSEGNVINPSGAGSTLTREEAEKVRCVSVRVTAHGDPEPGSEINLIRTISRNVYRRNGIN